MRNEKITPLYERLSRDDELQGESSPITDDGQFPDHGLVWEINYRGDLIFKDQAMGQKEQKHLTVEDGWTYFIHGWTQVIAEVFHIDLSERIPELSEIAKNA